MKGTYACATSRPGSGASSISRPLQHLCLHRLACAIVTRLLVNELGKFLVIVGLIVIGVGLLLWSGFGKGWFGRLPGDIHYTRGNFTFYFPLATCLLVSLILTVILWLFRK